MLKSKLLEIMRQTYLTGVEDALNDMGQDTEESSLLRVETLLKELKDEELVTYGYVAK